MVDDIDPTDRKGWGQNKKKNESAGEQSGLNMKHAEDYWLRFHLPIEAIKREREEWKPVATPSASDLALQQERLTEIKNKLAALEQEKQQFRRDHLESGLLDHDVRKPSIPDSPAGDIPYLTALKLLTYRLDATRGEMFGSSVTRDIYSAMREVVEQDKNLDPVIVAEFLAKRDGSRNWLLTLMEMNERSVAIPKNVESYANIIKRQYQYRRDLQAAKRFLNELKEGEEGALNNLLSTMLRSDGKHNTHISDSLKAVVEHVDQLQQGLVEPGVKSGIYQLDNVTGGFQAGDLIVLAARTSVGKTAIMCNFVVNGNCSTGIISAEQSAQQLAQRMISIVADVNTEHMRTGKFTSTINTLR